MERAKAGSTGKREEETEEEEGHGLEGITFVKRNIRVEDTEGAGLIMKSSQREEYDSHVEGGGAPVAPIAVRRIVVTVEQVQLIPVAQL